MYYLGRTDALAMLDHLLTHRSVVIRERALSLLRMVDCGMRSEWLARAARDSEPRVSALAHLVTAECAHRDQGGFPFDLAESALAHAWQGSDLEWEWEYHFIGCTPDDLPMATRIVWLERDDDDAACEVAAMRWWSAGRPGGGVIVIVDKRLVNRYTRSPKTAGEARRWQVEGRPRYTG